MVPVGGVVGLEDFLEAELHFGWFVGQGLGHFLDGEWVTATATGAEGNTTSRSKETEESGGQKPTREGV